MERLNKPTEDNIKLQDEAIELEEFNARTTGKPKTHLLARLYRVKSHLLQVLGRTDEAMEAT
eukprot:CAMPEP_0185594810 /NCGR_PEP_ID=MMETSP0434-20130131/76186_1 /TAXON_ID=626734 ORGANISM="Favella taraikaensis, Strain Fe Narragansett Bay" /NCGR_SAMPLE_ID=MMETSP0434 /ASSEMBLY_ACC=CAM_ASM_000379 /LENGTH=61 /DNA_ID=CAMNT_0028222383 /DNA_START=60 /DNA_END=245 /DNA_ORIENTATION=+